MKIALLLVAISLVYVQATPKRDDFVSSYLIGDQRKEYAEILHSYFKLPKCEAKKKFDEFIGTLSDEQQVNL